MLLHFLDLNFSFCISAVKIKLNPAPQSLCTGSTSRVSLPPTSGVRLVPSGCVATAHFDVRTDFIPECPIQERREAE